MNAIEIKIKNTFTGTILFKYATEKNSIKKTVEQANLGGADLRGADLRGADLEGADLGGANLYGADLGGANLYGADLRGADLRGADLGGADLGGADLGGANLYGADLYGADLRGADLGGADLGGAALGSFVISKATCFTDLYRYIAMPIISKGNEKYIRLGCYTRKVSEWEDNFWNNNNEFPNDGSIKSELRKMAFETCKKWIEINS